MLMRILTCAALLVAWPPTIGAQAEPTAAAQTKRPLAIADLFRAERLGDFALSPDGRFVAFVVSTPDLEANRNTTDVWVAPLDGGPARRLTTHPAADRSPAWSPDSRSIAFESTRSGESQIWILSLAGGEARQFTTLSTGAGRPLWSPDGAHLAFVSQVFPEFSEKPFAEADRLNRERLESAEKDPVKARIITSLLYRQWQTWRDGRRQHVFVQPLGGGQPRNLTPGPRDAVPLSMTFSSGIDIAFSPDGKELAFTATPSPVREEAWSTNHDIYTVSVAGGPTRQITTNAAADTTPRYSPDGRYLAYRAQEVPQYESDRWQLMLYDRTTGQTRSVTAAFDASPGPPAWSPDSQQLYFPAEFQGNEPIWRVGIDGGTVTRVFDRATNTQVAVTPDGRRLVFSHTSAVRPAEIYTAEIATGAAAAVTALNDRLFAGLDIPAPESAWFGGDGGTRVQAWIYRPPGFVQGRRYPLVYMVHGGPQGAWMNAWSFRWNPALWAAQGYVVIAPNPRGSTGFGQRFVEEVSRDWGGKAFRDLMRGLDWAESLPYVEKGNVAAAGASYGGYMMNWFQAHAGGRFRTLVTHCGVYNLTSMYGVTEETWFAEYDLGGPPWTQPETYSRFSPHTYADRFRTPNLVIHNELDFRVPIGEGLQLFTTLQRNGVASKLLYFPDEGHWVLKPANSRLWHETVFEWLAEYLRPQTTTAARK